MLLSLSRFQIWRWIPKSPDFLRCSIFKSLLKFISMFMFVQDLTFFPSSLIVGHAVEKKTNLAMRLCRDTMTSELDQPMLRQNPTPTNCIKSGRIGTSRGGTVTLVRIMYGNQSYLRNSQGSSAVHWRQQTDWGHLVSTGLVQLTNSNGAFVKRSVKMELTSWP